MVLLLQKLFRSSKLLANHHHYKLEASTETPLQVFRSKISISKFQPRTDTISLSWVQNCFNYFFDLNKAFARLAVEIDYPMSKWGLLLIEEYLNYTLRLLDLLNLVKSSIYHLSQARLSMALSLVMISNSFVKECLRIVEFDGFEMNLKIEEYVKERNFSGKEVVIHLALMEMKTNSDLVFGIVLSILSGDIKPYLEMKKLEANSNKLDGFIEKKIILKEIVDVKEAKARLIRAFEMGKNSEVDEDVKKLEIVLEEIQKQVDDIGNKANALFSIILAGRNQVLNVLRHQYQ